MTDRHEIFSKILSGYFPIVLAAVLFAASPATACTTPKGAKAEATRALDLVNAARAGSGRPAVSYNRRLAAAAATHSCFMADRQEATHTGKWGKDLGQRASNAGFHWSYVSENVAFGYRTADSVIQGWLDSPPHRKNMLSTRAREAAVDLRLGGDGKVYWTLILGAAK